MTLRDRVMKAASYSISNGWKTWNTTKCTRMEKGAQFENALLRPLIERLTECADALNRTKHPKHSPGHCATCDALTALEAELAKYEGER